MTEKERLQALYAYEVLDTEQEAEFDSIIQLASQICGTPVSLISLVDLDRQWFKARKGFSPNETSRSASFCAHAILKEGVMVVPDATKDARFANNPLVTGEPHIRFYAGAPLITPSGHALGSLCVIDKEARTLSEEQLFALQTLARQVITQLELRIKIQQQKKLLTAKDNILSVISHDVVGPLRNVDQLLALFEKEQVHQKDYAFLIKEMRTSLQSADMLLSDLLEWFMAQAGRQGLSYTKIHLARLADEIIDRHRSLLKQKNNEVQNLIPAELKLEADAEMLRFIIRNLLINANKFTLAGSITLTAEELTNSVRLSVRDTGVGMTQQQLDRLLKDEPPTTTKGTANEKGHGLGLMLSREFIEKHRGNITISSEAGAGTQVSIELPKSILEAAAMDSAYKTS